MTNAQRLREVAASNSDLTTEERQLCLDAADELERLRNGTALWQGYEHGCEHHTRFISYPEAGVPFCTLCELERLRKVANAVRVMWSRILIADDRCWSDEVEANYATLEEAAKGEA